MQHKIDTNQKLLLYKPIFYMIFVLNPIRFSHYKAASTKKTSLGTRPLIPKSSGFFFTVKFRCPNFAFVAKDPENTTESIYFYILAATKGAGFKFILHFPSPHRMSDTTPAYILLQHHLSSA